MCGRRFRHCLAVHQEVAAGLFSTRRPGTWHCRVPALHIDGGGLPSRHAAEQDCLSASAFALEGNPADYDPTAEALTLDVTAAPAA
jgi:hypothetical protein